MMKRIEVQTTPAFRTAILLPYYILIIAGLVIPSDGSHGFFNIKSLAFLGTIGTISSYFFLKMRFHVNQLKIALFFSLVILFCAFWLLVSLFVDETPFESTFDQLKIFILTFSVLIVSCYVVSEKLISFQQVCKFVLVVNFSYSLTKVLLVIFHLMGVLDMWKIIDMTGIRFMSMNIIAGLPRMQTSMDISTPYFLFFFLQSAHLEIKWPKNFSFIYLPISLFAIFLSFSRYLIAVALFVFFLHLLTLSFRSIIIALTTALIGIIITIALVGPDSSYSIIERRFFSQDTHYSDEARFKQADALMKEYWSYPWFGKGLGSYTKESIRDDKLLYSYEVQWVAFLLQFGIVGTLSLIIAAFVIIWNLLQPPHSRVKFALMLLFICWLISGFTNPFLLSLTSGIVYSLFLLAAIHSAKASGFDLSLEPKTNFQMV